jgi:hypothetical protein
MDQYRADNTVGYTERELTILNSEVDCWLLYARMQKGDDLTMDETDELIKRHMDDVAGR